MYYPVNWPRVIRLPTLGSPIIHRVVCNRDKILVAVLSSDTLTILYNKPCVPVACLKRDDKSLNEHGENQEVEWKPDSSAIAITTSKGYLSFYDLSFLSDQQHLYEQKDSSVPGLRRESAELFVKDSIPAFSLKHCKTIPIDSGATGMVCIRDELMVATKYGHILRYHWNGTLNRDYCLDLRRVPFCVDQLAARAVPITEPNTFVSLIDYSPLLGGFAVVLNDGRGAFLTATTLKFDPNQVQGIWAPLDDVTCTAINHRYRLVAFGRRNSHADVYTIDETTGGLQLSHTLQLSSKDFPGSPGPVQLLKWSPDGCCLALCWAEGAVSLWSTFGALLLCTLNWDYGSAQHHSLTVRAMDWGIEGYQLWMISLSGDVLTQMELLKSPLTANPCMSSKERLYLHGQDRIYINISDTSPRRTTSSSGGDSGALLSSKQWLVVQAPSAYMAGNWPLRFATLDAKCENLAVAGRTGFALYSFATRRWKLFGNESQERDFVVAGGLLWLGSGSQAHVVMGCYNIGADRDEIRLYPRDNPRLDNASCTIQQVAGQILLLNMMRDTLLVYTSDCHISLFEAEVSGSGQLQLSRTQEIDVSTLGLHPACLVAATLTSLSHATEPQQSHGSSCQQNILLNVCGRVLLIQRSEGPDESDEGSAYYSAPTVLASSVEILWVPNPDRLCPRKPHLTQALWLCCGAHGMRVWLPLYPREGDKGHHAFMSKRIMLPFQLHIYPLSVLFEEAILIGVETDTLLYPSSGTSENPWLIPLCVIERNSQVYLHHIFRQLIRRNLGFHAWEIARGCTALPYFSHSLELLLHEVLEEEATSKEPIPDALLPSVLEFIQEFPVYLKTIVQCARKTEVALWPYLFGAGVAANPRQLFQRCLDSKQLDLAASYLIILQNMEPVSISRQYATVLLDAALENCSWDLAKELVRFLRAIDPSDADSATPSFSSAWKPGSAPSPAGSLLPSKISLGSQTPPVSPNPEDFNFLLGSTVHRPGSRTAGSMKSPSSETNAGFHREITRSISETIPISKNFSTPPAGKEVPPRKKSAPVNSHPITITAEHDPPDPSLEELYMDLILQRHVRRLLSAGRLRDLGYLVAHFECPLVNWLSRERMRAARVDDFVSALRRLHTDFNWPFPTVSSQIVRKLSNRSTSLEEKLQALEVDVTAAPVMTSARSDPPYQLNGEALLEPINGGLLLQTVEAQLKPHVPSQEEWSVQSEGDQISLAGEDRLNDLDGLQESSWGVHTMTLEVASAAAAINEPLQKANAQSELQLRYLLQLFTEADCLDWALILAVTLRDAMAVLRLVSMMRSALNSCQPSNQAATIEVVTRLRDALLALSHWAETDCQGYRPFMNVIYGQVGILTKLILPQSNGPLTLPAEPSVVLESGAATQGTGTKSRHTSVTLLTPLGRVPEEDMDIPVFKTNGKLDLPPEGALLQLSHQLEQSTKKEQQVNQHQGEPVQAQQGSSCVIS